MYIRKIYFHKGFSKLIKTDAWHDMTYIVEGFVFVSNGIWFKRMNNKPLTIDKIIEFENFADENDENVMLVYVGDGHTKRMSEYLDRVNSIEATN